MQHVGHDCAVAFEAVGLLVLGGLISEGADATEGVRSGDADVGKAGTVRSTRL